jgi:TonB family protein
MRGAVRFLSALLEGRRPYAGWARTSARRRLLICVLATVFATATAAPLSCPAAAAPIFRPAQPIPDSRGIPPYPASAVSRGKQGRLRLNLTVTPEGRVSNVRVARSTGSEALDAPTARWIMTNWHFRPATVDGKPVRSEVMVDIRFALQPAG